jgi:hypothetical protein
VTEEALLRDAGFASPLPEAEGREEPSDVREDAINILVSLGHRRGEAVSKVDAALKRDPSMFTPQDVITAVYRAERSEAAAPT